MITVYGIPNCNSVKKAREWLKAHEQAYVFHDFKKQGVPEAELRRWVAQLGWEKLLNRQGTTWRGLPAEVQAKVLDAQAAIQVMLQHASTIKRPVVVKGEHLLVGWGVSSDMQYKCILDE